MEIVGEIIDILEEQSGNGRNGEWRKQSYILETLDQYPKKVCMDVWGDKIDTFDLKKGEQVTAKVNVESREFNGKWYTDVKIWAVDRQGGASTNNAPVNPASDFQNQGAQPSSGPQEVPPPSADDELPF